MEAKRPGRSEEFMGTTRFPQLDLCEKAHECSQRSARDSHLNINELNAGSESTKV